MAQKKRNSVKELTGKVLSKENDSRTVAVPGVAVSNGRDVTITNEDGKYALPFHAGETHCAFISTPPGYALEDGFHQPANGEAREFVLKPVNTKKEFCFVQITDIHVTNNEKSEHFKEYLNEITALKTPPDFVVCTGDLISNANDPEEHRYFKEGLEGFPFHIRLLPGNHDMNQGDTRPARFRELFGPEYYSFNYGSCHFTAINNYHPEAAQDEWLLNDLQAADESLTGILLLHYPPTIDFLRQYSTLGIKAVFSGHWHSSKITRIDSITSYNTPAFRFGGIDGSPAGMRIIHIKGSEIETEYRHHPGKKQFSINSEIKIENLEGIKPDGDWSTYKGTSDRCGYLQNGPVPPYKTAWISPLGEEIDYASPIIVGDKVITGTKDRNGAGNPGITALDIKTGRLVWHYGINESFNRSPIYHKGVLYAVTMGGTVHAVDIDNGECQWTFPLGDGMSRWVYAAPLIDNDVLYAGNAAWLAAIDLKNIDINNIKPLWEKTYCADWISNHVSPSIMDGTIVLGTVWDERSCFAVDKKDGRMIWAHKAGGTSINMAAAMNKKTAFVIDHNSVLTALHLGTGIPRWTKKVGEGWSLSSPSITDELIVAASGDGILNACDIKTGEILWKFEGGEGMVIAAPYDHHYTGIFGTPIIVDKHVLIGNADGNFYVISLETGKPVWWTEVGAPVVCAPAVTGNMVLFTAMDGCMHALIAE